MTYGTLNADLIGNSNGQTGNAIGPGFKNRIINGAMMIAQRGTTFSGLTNGDNATYTVDRWAWGESGTSTGVQTISQDTSAPTGFTNSLKIETTTAHSVGTDNSYNVYQWIEGLNVADLAWGTASAFTVTISFWVRSSLTGTFAGALQNSAFDNSYVFNYTINAANTWEQKTITVAGPTSGTWLTTNGRGMRIVFDLGTGSTYQTTANTWVSGSYISSSGAVSVIGTLNATWYITGAQLEVGSSATSFDYRPYGTELSLCQRYFQQIDAADARVVAYGATSSSTNMNAAFPIPVSLRAVPTVAYQSTAPNIVYGGASYAVTALSTVTLTTNFVNVQTTSSGMSGANSATLRTATGTGWIRIDSEL